MSDWFSTLNSNGPVTVNQLHPFNATSSLAFERETGKTLGIRVDKLLDENNKLSIENDKLVTENDKLVSENDKLVSENDKLVHENNHLKQLLERVSHLLNKVQPCAPVKQIRGVLHNAEPESWDSDFWSDSDDGVEEISDSEPQSISLRPLVKTETAVDDNDEIRTTVRTIPLPPAELVKIQKFSRRSGESEVEYVCRVSLKGGDQMMLSEEEVGGFWRPGVFLTTTPGADLAVAVQKAACIQAIYERDEFRKSPMLAPIDPIRLTPLIRGLPDCLKMFVANTQDHILAACRDDDSGCRQNPNSPIPTWSELVRDIDKYGHRMGWINSSSIKSQDHSRRVHQIHTKNPRYPKFKERLKPNREREAQKYYLTKDKKPLPPQIFENEPTQPPIGLTPSIFKTGPYIIKNVGQQQILFNPSWSLKRVELALHINISEINSKCTTFLRTAYTGWLAWLHGRSLKQSQRVPRDATGLLGTGLGILNSIDAEVLMSRVTATTDDLRKLEQPIKSSLLALGANQWLLSDILPHWEQIEENDHQLIVNALGKAQGNTSLALSCIQAQLWIQSVAAAIIREGEGGTLPTEIRKLIWDNASEFEKEFQAWWQLVNFTHYAENDKIVAFILTISNATVYNVYPIIALGLNHNGTILYPKEHKVWAHQKGGKWQTIDVNACIVREQKGFICESNTLESQDICLDTEQNICHFEIHPNETLETVLIYIGKGCVCMRTHCDSIVVDDTVVDTSNHSNVCVCNFTKILGCDFKYSAPVTSYQLIASNYILLHELLPTPIGMNLTLVKKLLVHEDLKQLMTQVRENGQKTLITVHHDAQEIHRVMERVKRDERHRWWDTLFGWSPAAKGIFNKMLHPVIVLLILTVLCFILTISLYVKLWFMMKRLASLHNVHTLDKPQSENVCDIPDIFQLS
ncbi:uncharacterized protein [Anas acuta]|uniref:uncharacterized protein n=1 Tax=Anas acuta TaxID=28680 RepID=UPI0035C8A1D2